MRVVIAVLAALALAGPAAAGGIVVHLDFAPGQLRISAPAVKLPASGSATIVVAVADGRGSGAGWRLTANNGLSVRSITAACAAGSTCTLPEAAAVPSGATILRAKRGTGMGVIRLTIGLRGAAGTAVRFAVS